MTWGPEVGRWGSIAHAHSSPPLASRVGDTKHGMMKFREDRSLLGLGLPSGGFHDRYFILNSSCLRLYKEVRVSPGMDTCVPCVLRHHMQTLHWHSGSPRVRSPSEGLGSTMADSSCVLCLCFVTALTGICSVTTAPSCGHACLPLPRTQPSWPTLPTCQVLS